MSVPWLSIFYIDWWLGPVLYSIFTADLPVSDQTLTATYADDTAILASRTDPLIAGRHLQQHMDKLEH